MKKLVAVIFMLSVVLTTSLFANNTDSQQENQGEIISASDCREFRYWLSDTLQAYMGNCQNKRVHFYVEPAAKKIEEAYKKSKKTISGKTKVNYSYGSELPREASWRAAVYETSEKVELVREFKRDPDNPKFKREKSGPDYEEYTSALDKQLKDFQKEVRRKIQDISEGYNKNSKKASADLAKISDVEIEYLRKHIEDLK